MDHESQKTYRIHGGFIKIMKNKATPGAQVIRPNYSIKTHRDLGIPYELAQVLCCITPFTPVPKHGDHRLNMVDFHPQLASCVGHEVGQQKN